MPKKKMARANPGVIVIENPQKTSLVKPPAGCHGLVLPNGSATCLIGGVGSSKTTTTLNIIARCADWLPYDQVYLMSPNIDTAIKGEYGLVKAKRFPDNIIPPLTFFNDKPGHTCVILDDITLEMSTKKHKEDGLSQRDRLNRLVGHMRSHHEGGLDVFICQQQMIAVPTSIRRLCSHFVLFPNRIDRGSMHTIARSVMINKRTLEHLFDACSQMGPYTFILVEQERLSHRARVRINGHQEVPGIN
jgi:hypothetical protein